MWQAVLRLVRGLDAWSVGTDYGDLSGYIPNVFKCAYKKKPPTAMAIGGYIFCCVTPSYKWGLHIKITIISWLSFQLLVQELL